MNKWFAKHKWVTMLIFNVLVWIPVILILDMANIVLSPGWVIYGLFMFFFSYMWADSFKIVLLNKALATFDNMCDPCPLEETVWEQLSYVKSKSQRIGLFINLSAVLDATGRYDEFAVSLERIDIDTCTSVTPLIKCVYYHNLACSYLRTKRMELVPFLLQKEHQILSNLKVRRKLKNKLAESYNLNLADFHICNKEYDIANSLIETICLENVSLRYKVTINSLKAQILIETGKPDEAKPFLQFVIDYGNKLYDVTNAKQMLEQIGKDGNNESVIF